MGRKVFAERNGYSLMGDERSVMVRSKHKLDVLDWCDANGITAELDTDIIGRGIIELTWSVNLWRVKDEKQRVAFALRWS